MRVSESLELEIQAIVNHPVQMLGSELGFSTRAVHSWLLSQLSVPSPTPSLLQVNTLNVSSGSTGSPNSLRSSSQMLTLEHLLVHRSHLVVFLQHC